MSRVLILFFGLQYQLTDELNKVDGKLKATEALLESKVRRSYCFCLTSE